MEITNKYHNGKIYKIVDIGYNKCYIGSTTEGLSTRMARHRASFKQFLNNGKGYTRSFDLFNEYEVENCKIELIEYYKCDTLQELRKREGEVIKNNECVNKVVAGRTIKEYQYDNNDKIKEQKKEYREDNRDKILEQKKEYREQHKDKIKESKREYREQNRDKINEKKEYYELNKNKINEHRQLRYKLKQEIHLR